MANGKIAGFEQFLLLPQCFRKSADSKNCYVRKMGLINPFLHFLTPLQQTTFENTDAKAEIAHDAQFPLLPQCLQLSKSSVADFVYAGKGLHQECDQVQLLENWNRCRFINLIIL